MKNKFPKNFLWGVSTSSYQIEGNNSNSDWWEWEQSGKTKEKSGRACDYWNRYEKDHELLEELGAGGFRLSLEWARVEPEEGKFSQEAIARYREILGDLKRRNIKTVVTFWHWTSPIWFGKKYGLHKKESIEIFSRYGKKIVDELGDLVDIAVVINEPMMPLAFGYLRGNYPPGSKNIFKYFKAFQNLSAAYKIIYNYSKQKFPHIPVGITQLYNFLELKNSNNPVSRLSVYLAKKFWNDSFLKKIKNHMDYIGLDYYFHNRINYFFRDNKNQKITDMGWEIYPSGIYHVLLELKEKYNLPVYILENGLADAKDKYRTEFIKDHLRYVLQAMEEGADVRGYFHWSFLDNFEWLYGYYPRFGLVEVDYETQERKPRGSFYIYRDIIKNNGL